MGEGNWEEAELGELCRERLSDPSTEKGREGEQSSIGSRMYRSVEAK